MEEIQKGATAEVAGLKAGMGRKAAAKYARLGKLPSELKEPRAWRTRPDPFSAASREGGLLHLIIPADHQTAGR